MITSHIQKSLYICIPQHKLCKCMSHNDETPGFLQNNIDYIGLRIANKEVRFNMLTFIRKWISGDLATSKIMVFR